MRTRSRALTEQYVSYALLIEKLNMLIPPFATYKNIHKPLAYCRGQDMTTVGPVEREGDKEGGV